MDYYCSSFRSLLKLFILRFFTLMNSQSITAVTPEPHFKQVVIKDQAASLILVSRWGSNVIWKYFVFLLSNFGENGKELPSVEISNLLHLNPQLNTLVNQQFISIMTLDWGYHRVLLQSPWPHLQLRPTDLLSFSSLKTNFKSNWLHSNSLKYHSLTPQLTINWPKQQRQLISVGCSGYQTLQKGWGGCR